MLRWETPVPGVARIALQDFEVGGCPISKGERVSPLLGAANTDPDEFTDPDVVDFARSPNRHRAFGGGPHRCLGSHLAATGAAGGIARISPSHTGLRDRPWYRTQIHQRTALSRSTAAEVLHVMTRVSVDPDTLHRTRALLHSWRPTSSTLTRSGTRSFSRTMSRASSRSMPLSVRRTARKVRSRWSADCAPTTVAPSAASRSTADRFGAGSRP